MTTVVSSPSVVQGFDPLRDKSYRATMLGRDVADFLAGQAGERNRRASTPRHRASVAEPDEHGLKGERRQHTKQRHVDGHDRAHTAWGVYEPAIRRWEHTLGRPAPRPTDDRGRLMPEFVEWMMGFPDGWVDGAKRTHALRMLGNAVVPQQGELAIRLLAASASVGAPS